MPLKINEYGTDSFRIARKNGLAVDDLIDLLDATNKGNNNVVPNLCVSGVESGLTVFVSAVFSPNSDGEPGGVLYLHLNPSIEEKVAAAFDDGLNDVQREQFGKLKNLPILRFYVDSICRQIESKRLTTYRQVDEAIKTALAFEGLTQKDGKIIHELVMDYEASTMLVEDDVVDFTVICNPGRGHADEESQIKHLEQLIGQKCAKHFRPNGFLSEYTFVLSQGKADDVREAVEAVKYVEGTETKPQK